jgi:hypothetical protein
MEWSQRDSWTRHDSALLVLFSVLGSVMAWLLVHQVGSVFFYQNFTPEPLMWACGHGFRHPLTLSPEMANFLLNRTASVFDCSTISVDLKTGPAGMFSRLQLYFSLIAAGSWRLIGPTQMAMVPLAALLAAGYAAGTYILARLFYGRIFGSVGALFLTLSPVAIGMIFDLRDYSKAPFFLWSITLLVLAGRATLVRHGLLFALIAGAIGGLGYGFRGDIAIMLPFGLGFLVLASRLDARARLGVAAAYAGGFLLLATPILLQGAEARLGSIVMQGMTEPFRELLALRPAPYSLGNAYSDELTLSAVAAAERPRRPDWDAREPEAIYGVSQSMTFSMSNLMEWAPHFIADFGAQAIKGAAWILGYPALVAISRGNIDPGSPMRLDVPIVHWQEPVYALFGQPWMPLLGFIGVLALLLRVAARSSREALGLAALLLGLTTYPGAIQFSVRHVFFLEFVWALAVLALPCALLEWRRLTPALPRFAVFVALTLGAVASTYIVLSRLQQRWLTEDFSSLLALPRGSVAIAREPRNDGALLLRVPIPPAYAALVSGPPDSMTDLMPVVGNQWNVRAAGDRMLLTMEGPTCPDSPAVLGVLYDRRPQVWQPLDSQLMMRPGDIVIFTAFYRPTQAFAGIIVPKSHAGCTANMFRLPLAYNVPLVLTAVLAPNWTSLPLRKELGWFDLHRKR